jgi:hypothetical protein
MTNQPEPPAGQIPVQFNATVVPGTRPTMIAMSFATPHCQLAFVTDLNTALQVGDLVNQVIAQIAPAAKAAQAGLILPNGVVPPSNGRGPVS